MHYSDFDLSRHALSAALLLAACLIYPKALSAQERPKAAIAPQASGLDIEKHIDLLVGAEEAQNHFNEVIMVCGVVADTYHESSDKTFLDSHYYAGQRNTHVYFDKPRGEHDFVAIVHGTARKDMPKQPESLKDHRACVFGKVSRYRQRAAMWIVRAEQIAALDPAAELNE